MKKLIFILSCFSCNNAGNSLHNNKIEKLDYLIVEIQKGEETRAEQIKTERKLQNAINNGQCPNT